MVLAACGGTEAPAAKAPAAKAPAAEAPAAKAPAAKAPAAKAPAAEAPAAKKATFGTGTGKLAALIFDEVTGHTIITDPAKFPKTYSEAPQLAALVAAGKLPPVAERVGDEPLVIKPLHSNGKHGGIWRRGFTGPADSHAGWRCCAGPDTMFFWSPAAKELQPNVMKGYEMSDGGKTFIFHLRKGMKWSDGAPFTADDFMFWYEDMYDNKKLVRNKDPWFSTKDVQGTLEKIDDTTLKVTFQHPYPFFPSALANGRALGGHAKNGRKATGGFAPRHYLTQFLPKYTGDEAGDKLAEEAADKLAKDVGFDNWPNLFKFKNTWGLNPELPAITPWLTVTPVNSDTWKLERNAYYWQVDTDGNQLPYFDTVIHTVAENLEVINLRAIAGEFDMQSRHMNLAKVPLFLANAEKGKYKLALDPSDSGSDAPAKFNQNYDEDPYIGGLMRNRDFRRALSLGIDREQINEVYFLGLGTPGSNAPREGSRYSPGPDSVYRNVWATFEPDRANKMLDALGLDKRDSEGWRLRADNGERLKIEISARIAQHLEFVGVGEMVGEHWEKHLNLKTPVQALERSLAGTLSKAGKNMVRVSWGDWTMDMFASCNQIFACSSNSEYGRNYGLWFVTGGEKGDEPNDILKDVQARYKDAMTMEDAERIEAGKEIWKIVVEEVYSIGTVGLSPASQGVRVYKKDLANIPERMYNCPCAQYPAVGRPYTWYWKTEANRPQQTLTYEK
jgi:peptide/nickel transport system substrate-binding protein